MTVRKKVFEGDILHSYFEANSNEPAREFWRLIAYRAAGFCELATPTDEADDIETIWLTQYSAAHRGERLSDRVVNCYYLQPELLKLNSKYGYVPASFD